MKSFLFLVAVGALAGQVTKVDLARRATNVDLATQPFTRPWKTDTAIPANCTLKGAAFYKSTTLELWICDGTHYQLFSGGGGGGGTGNAGALTIANITGTPVLSCLSATAGTVDHFQLTVTGPVVGAYTIAPCTTGQDVDIAICENAAGGFAVTLPTNLKGFPAIDTAAHMCTAARGSYDGTNINITSGAHSYKDDHSDILGFLILSDGAGGKTTIVPSAGNFSLSFPAASGTLSTGAGGGVNTFVLNTLAAGTGILQPANGATTFAPVGGADSFSATTESWAQVPVATTGTLKNAALTTVGAQDAGGDMVWTLRKNGVDTAIVVTVPAGSAAGTFKDVTHTATLSGGTAAPDLIDWKVTQAGATSAFVPSVSVTLQ